MTDNIAPGKPGIAPAWSSSDKDFVTTALGSVASLGDDRSRRRQ